MVNEEICSTTKGNVTSTKKGTSVSRHTGGQGLKKLPFKDMFYKTTATGLTVTPLALEIAKTVTLSGTSLYPVIYSIR